MSIALDATSTSITTTTFGAGTKTFSHTVGSGNDRLLVVMVDLWQTNLGSGNVTGITYNGVALSHIDDVLSGRAQTEMWYLINPASGTHNVSVTTSASADALKIGASSFTGVAQTASLVTHVTNSGTTANPAQSLTTSNNGALIVEVIQRITTTNVVEASSQTNLFNDRGVGIAAVGSYKLATTAGSYAMNYTVASGQNWAMVVSSFKPVPPTVTSVSPTSGVTAGGTSVTVTGTGFVAGATVTFGGTSATGVSVVSGTSITCTAPAHSAGTVNVVTTNADATSATLSSGFTYTVAVPSTATAVGTVYAADNAAAVVGWGNIEISVGNDGYIAVWLNGILVADVTDLTYTPNGNIGYGSEASSCKIAPGISQQAGSTLLNNQGSLANVPDYTFSYASTTTSVTWSWSAFTIYRPDGSTIVVSSGSQAAFTGLSSSTTYYFGIYYDLVAGVPVVVKSDVSSGTAAESLAQLMQVVNADGAAPIDVNRTAATPSSGSGGGSGGGGGGVSCFSPETLVKTSRGDIAIADIHLGDYVLTARGTWRRVTAVTTRDYDGDGLQMGDGIVTPEHLVLSEGKWVKVDSLGLFARTAYKGTIHNLHVETDADDDGSAPDTEHSYTLSNGLIVHNVLTSR